MNLIQYLAALNAVALSIHAGSVDVAQCNGRSPLWVKPTLCTDAAKCSDSKILSASNYDIFDVSWSPDDEQVTSSFVGNGQCNRRSPLWVSPSLCADTATGLSKCSRSQILSDQNHDMFDVSWAQDDEQVNTVLTNFLTCASLTRDVEMQKEGELCEAWAQDDEQVNSMLTNFMTWACLTRDVEMQKEGQEMCEASNEEQVNALLIKFMTWACLTRDFEMQKEDQDLCEASNENMPWDFEMCAGDLKLVHRTQPMLGHSDYSFDTKRNPAMSRKDDRKDMKSGFGLPREKGPSVPATATVAPSIRRSSINLSHGLLGNFIPVDAIE